MKVTLVDNPTVTRYLWGDMSEIAGKTLEVLERNSSGDCLCVCDKGIVDVSKEDIKG